ncbi:hypothetical protein ASZ90_019287 [hydrocarbon metagenome]|uniref:DUF2334 domain-containing protein n=1 Tax=hydrocarbon metagenome TaxID=938273 RepID=A0A0W8E3U6_9ZZZZ
MRRALIRFEDVGPGSPYDSAEALHKLRIIADYLASEGVPFHISIIPRFIDPSTGYDKSIDMNHDPYVRVFIDTIKYCCEKNAALGMHGYTHQYSESVSADGWEFAFSYDDSCPPDDVEGACSQPDAFIGSYAYSRLKQGFNTFAKSDLRLGWGFSTPHYTASPVQRCIIEAWSGLLFENSPCGSTPRQAALFDKDNEFYRGVIYVPTPLFYIMPDRADLDVERICQEIREYQADELAAFFYHPYLDFPFITKSQNGEVSYDENSYLKRLISCFKKEGFVFVPILSLFDFVPASRRTGFYPGTENIIFTGRIDNSSKIGLIVWQPASGNWFLEPCPLENYPSRQYPLIQDSAGGCAMEKWAQGKEWTPLIGDFNGDGIDDVVVWNYLNGDWQVAINNGSVLTPDLGRGDFSWLQPWARGKGWVPFVGDFDGDGKDDILVWDTGTGIWQVALSDGRQFLPSPGRGDFIWLEGWAVGSEWVPMIGDFNGDGKSDIVAWNPDTGEWRVAMSNGSRFVPEGGKPDAVWLGPWALGTEWKALVGDFNGDGCDDIVVVNPDRGEWQVALSNGDHFRPTGNVFYPWAADPDMQPYTGDFNGDGTYAIMARHPNLRNGTLDVAVSVLDK